MENEKKSVTGRFAPSPSGFMHLGNIFSCLISWLSAKKQNGKIVLRMEDLDTERCPRHFADKIMEDLSFLGLTWDSGPFFQSERTPFYKEMLERLKTKNLIYPCFCSRSETHAANAPHRSDGQVIYTGTCRNLTNEEIQNKAKKTGRNPAMRIIVPDEEFSFCDGHYGMYSENLSRDCGDFLLCRSDGIFAYQLAVVADDAAMGITQVVRGSDLITSTPRQIYLYRMLGFEVPEFFHFPLLLSPDGRKLSKRDRDDGLDVLKERFTAEEILGKLAFAAGFNPSGEPKTAVELIEDFEWEKLPEEDIFLPENLFQR